MIAGELQVGGDLLTSTLIRALTNDSRAYAETRHMPSYALARKELRGICNKEGLLR
jgi:hypothetical protein